jgi:hypothetical protein
MTSLTPGSGNCERSLDCQPVRLAEREDGWAGADRLSSRLILDKVVPKNRAR